MSLVIRRVIFVVFLLIFFLISPLVILYAAGYKFSKSGLNFQKTGMFILDSKPKGAKIYLNGKLQQTFLKKLLSSPDSFITTPAKIKNLLPAEYNLTLAAAGYWPWQKKLKIESGASTYAEDIYLFKKELPISLVSGEIKKIQLSPNKNLLALLANQQLVLINLASQEQTFTPIFIAKTDQFSWSPDSQWLLVNQQIFNSQDLKQIINLKDFIKSQTVKYQWLAGKLSYFDKDGINVFDPQTTVSQQIIATQKPIDFLIKDNYLYLIVASGQTVNLNIIKLDNRQLIRSINLPGSTNYYFTSPQHQLVNIYDQDHQILYLIDPFFNAYSPLVEAINNLKQSYWLASQKLLYANDFEIWLFDLASREKTILARISNPIGSLLWHPSNNYLIYSTDKTINILELDQREKRNLIELINFDQILSPVLNSNGDQLYFVAKIGNQEGLYKLAIQ